MCCDVGNPSGIDWSLISIIANISSIAKDFDKITFCHISRSLNEVVHWLAKFCQSFNCGVEWLNSYPYWFFESVTRFSVLMWMCFFLGCGCFSLVSVPFFFFFFLI